MAKYNEALLKAKSLFANDPMFTNFISSDPNIQERYIKIHRKQKKVGLKPIIKVVIGFILFLILLLGLMPIIRALGY